MLDPEKETHWHFATSWLNTEGVNVNEACESLVRSRITFVIQLFTISCSWLPCFVHLPTTAGLSVLCNSAVECSSGKRKEKPRTSWLTRCGARPAV